MKEIKEKIKEKFRVEKKLNWKYILKIVLWVAPINLLIMYFVYIYLYKKTIEEGAYWAEVIDEQLISMGVSVIISILFGYLLEIALFVLLKRKLRLLLLFIFNFIAILVSSSFILVLFNHFINREYYFRNYNILKYVGIFLWNILSTIIIEITSVIIVIITFFRLG